MEPQPAPQSEAFSTASEPAPRGSGHHVRLQRYHIQMNAAGPFRPNQPIAVRAVVRGLRDARDTRMRLSLPDVEAGERAGWDISRWRTPVGSEIPARERARGAIGQGTERVLATTFEVPLPGYYRVYVAADPTEDLFFIEDGVSVAQSARQELWIWVDERGGFVTESFDPTLFGDTLVAKPGPFQRWLDWSEVGIREQAQLSTTRQAEPTFMHSSGGWAPPEITAVYDNRHFDPVREDPVAHSAQVRLAYEYFDKQTGAFRSIEEWTNTGTDGRFTINCGYIDQAIDGLVQVRVEVWVRNFMVNLIQDIGTTVTGNAGFSLFADPGMNGICHNPQAMEVRTPSNAAEVFTNLSRSIPVSRSEFNVSRGRVDVRVISDGHTEYKADEDRIYILRTSHIFRSGLGVIAQLHEYGHALHHVAFGNLDRFACLNAHWWDRPVSIACAFGEGFADFHAAVSIPLSGRPPVVADSLQNYVDTIEANGWYPGERQTNDDSFNEDGSAIEGAVAAFLWDLTDPFDADEPWDTLEFPMSLIADLWAECRVQRPDGSIRQADGIDDIIYCLEREVDSAVRNHEYYFATRDDWDDAVTVTQTPSVPPGWNKDEIRTVWVTNLHSLEPGEAGGGGTGGGGDPGGGGGGDCEREPLKDCPND